MNLSSIIIPSFQMENTQTNALTSSDIDELNILQVKCNCFVSKCIQEPYKCGCGKHYEQHSYDVRINEHKITTWNSDECCIDYAKTDAYGLVNIKKQTNDKSLSHYLRLSYKTHTNNVSKILFHKWKLSKPMYVLSVIGGGDVTLNSRVQNVFINGLVKCVRNTNAWIITNGLNYGPAKYIGDVASKLLDDQTFVVLGVSSWNKVLNTNCLIRNKRLSNEEPVLYEIKIDDKNRNDERCLQPGHTHFLLVDDASTLDGCEAKFRLKLEKKLIAMNESGCDETLLVYLIFGDMIDTIENVIHAIRDNIPCLFIKDSGKLSKLFEYMTSHRDEFDQLNLRRCFNSLWNDINDKEAWFDKISIIHDSINLHLLSFFDLNDEEEFDVAILKAFLTASFKNHSKQLELCKLWNHIDLARDLILRNDVIWKESKINSLIYEIIIQNRIDFVRLFYECKFSIKSFLTNRRFLKLFNDIVQLERRENGYLSQIMSKAPNKTFVLDSEIFDFNDLQWLLRSLTNKLFELEIPECLTNDYDLSQYLANTDQHGSIRFSGFIKEESKSENALNKVCDEPENYLLIMSIIRQNYEMAEVFWEYGQNQIFMALIVSLMLKIISNFFQDDSKLFIEKAKIFEDLAIKMLNHGIESNEKQAQYLLIKQLQQYNNLTCLQVAVAAHDIDFVGHTCCQNLISSLWYRQLAQQNSRLSIGLSIACPILAPLLIEYKQDGNEDNVLVNKWYEHSSDERVLKTCASVIKIHFKKIFIFLDSPNIKFIYDQISHTLLLLLFTYIMLCDFYPLPTSTGSLSISSYEICLYIWLLNHAIDYMIRHYFIHERSIGKAKLDLVSYAGDIMHTFSYVLFMIPMVLRYIPNCNNCYLSARILLSLDIILWYLKSLRYYSVFRYFGPKILMIKKMMVELAYFILIMIVFIFAFGVSTQSLMYHNQELSFELLEHVFLPAYWVLGGEFYIRDSIMSANQCKSKYNASRVNQDIYKQVYGNEDLSDCPEPFGARVSLGIYVAYVITLEILLTNLLIAIFSNTFEQIQNASDNIWKFQRYSLVYDYCHRSILCGPFLFIHHIMLIVRLMTKYTFKLKALRKIEKFLIRFKFIELACGYFSKQKHRGFRDILIKQNKLDRVSTKEWEYRIQEEYIANKNANRRERQDFKVELLLQKMDVLQRKQEALDRRMVTILESIVANSKR